MNQTPTSPAGGLDESSPYRKKGTVPSFPYCDNLIDFKISLWYKFKIGTNKKQR